MRVLLLSPNRLRFPYPVYPLGLDYVANALSATHEVRILDLCPLSDDEVGQTVTGTIRGFAPDAIGISVRNIDNTDATNLREFVGDLATLVRAIRLESLAPIVLGGAGFTLYPQEVLAACGADYGLIGEGERAPALFDALAVGTDPSALPGVVCRGGAAPAIVPIPVNSIGHRTMPPPNPALEFYLSSCGIMNLQTQRGCVFRCVYCTYPTIEGQCVRPRPAEEVAREAVELQAAGARYLFLTDSVFNASPAHCLAVASAFRRAGLSIPWGAYFAPLSPPDGFYERMAEGGCAHVEFGTETLAEPMLRRIRKAFRRDDVFLAHRAARAAGLHVAHFLILGGPDETESTLEETFTAADRLRDAVLFFFCGMRIFRGTELARMAMESGQVKAGATLLEPVFYQPPRLALAVIEASLRERATGRPNWIVGGGEDRTHRATSRLYSRGHTGLLWEHLVGT